MVVQLVSIAVRALSPGINDPYTANMCLDRLSQAFCLLLDRQTPSRYRHDDTRHLRVIGSPLTTDDLFRTGFDQIRHYGHSDLKVSLRLLEVLEILIRTSQDAEQRHRLHGYADTVYRESSAQVSSSDEQEQLNRVYRKFSKTPVVMAEDNA
jgi:uncharacterized membrane protein